MMGILSTTNLQSAIKSQPSTHAPKTPKLPPIDDPNS